MQNIHIDTINVSELTVLSFTRTGLVYFHVIYIETKLTVKYIFFSNEASLEMPSTVRKQCKCSVGIRSDNVRLLEMESERDGRKKGGAVDHLLLFFLPWVSFLPQRERQYLNLFSGPETVSDALQWSLSLVTLTGESQPTAFRTLRGICRKPAYSHAHLHTHKPPNRCTNIVQVHPQAHYWNMYTVLTQTHTHSAANKKESVIFLLKLYPNSTQTVVQSALLPKMLPNMQAGNVCKVFHLHFTNIYRIVEYILHFYSLYRQLDCRQTTERYQWIYSTVTGEEAAQVLEPYFYYCSQLGTNTVLKVWESALL